jgi:hypothetical protein
VSLADDYVAALAPWMTPDLEVYLRAVGAMFAEVEMYAEDEEQPGWENLLDPDTCPAQALPYLAQYVGERLPKGLPEAQQRQWIKDAPNQRRGTVASFVRAAERALDPDTTQLVSVIERDGDVDTVTVVTYTDQTPDPVAVERELNTVFPLDMTLNYLVRDGETWTQVELTYATWDDIPAGMTWADLQAATPAGSYSR